MSNCFIIGVAGGSGSGKTFFSNKLAEAIGRDHCLVLEQDSYYIDQSHRFDHDGGSVNFDHPSSIDFNLMASHLHELKQGQIIEVPVYNFASHTREVQPVKHLPKKVVIVDGILVLSQPHLRLHFDERVFVETPESIRYERRLNRDIVERGRTKEGVENQFQNQVKPMHDQFVEPSKEFASLVSSGTEMESFHHTMQMIMNKIERMI